MKVTCRTFSPVESPLLEDLSGTGAYAVSVGDKTSDCVCCVMYRVALSDADPLLHCGRVDLGR